MKRPVHHTPDYAAQLPPQDLPLEAAILGAALLEAPAVRKAQELLPDEQVFYAPKHIAVWQAIRALSQEGQPVDMLTVMNKLRELGKLDQAGGPAYLYELTRRVTSAANIECHCRVLQQLYARRLIQQAARLLLAQAADDQVDPLELFADAQNTLTRLTRSISTRRAVTAASLYDETIEGIARACSSGGLTGIPTGWPALDGLTGGWQPGNLILLAARPAMGKSMLALAIARQAAFFADRRVLFVSLEMPARELMIRLVATEVGISNFKLSHGQLEGGRAEAYDIGASAHRVKSDRLLIDPSAALTVGQLRARATELKAEPAGLDLLIVDYVQLLKPDLKRSSREEEVADVSRHLKALALELEIPVIALAQLNREAEKRADKRPQTSDLRESGQLEQDADVIIFPWRGEVYGIAEYAGGTATAHTILLDFAKNRNGPAGEILLGCDVSRGRIWDL